MIGRYSDQMTYEYILGRMLEQVKDTVDKREGSVIYDALAPAAAELAKAYIELDVIMDETFVDTASLQYLMLRCKERGITIQPETAAIVQGTFTPSTLELMAGTRFNCDDVNYTITDKIANGVYRLKAETLGTAGNKYSGFLLPIQIVNGLETAEITNLLIPGEDSDNTETLRQKYYDSISSQAFGGNISDYREKVHALVGIGGVKVYPAWDGGGTVKLVILSSEFAVPSDELVSTVQTAIDPETNHGEGLGIAPIGHSVTVMGVTNAEVAVATNIVFSSGWDWSAAKNQIESAVNNYFHELAEAWEDSETTIVRIAQIENHILGLNCILDISDTTLNGQAKNLELDTDAIPVLKSIGRLT